MFSLNEEEKQMLVEESYKILNNKEANLIFRALLESVCDLKEDCIKAGYNINTSHIPEDICKAIMRIIIKG